MDTSYYIRFIVSLSVLLVVLVVVLRLVKMFHKKTYSGEMKIIDRLVLNATVSLLIVQVKDDEILLSVSGKEASILKGLS